MRQRALFLAAALVWSGPSHADFASKWADKYPLVGQVQPRLGYLLDHYTDSQICALLARNDFLLLSQSKLYEGYWHLFSCARRLNPSIAYFLMWAVRDNLDCATVAPGPNKLRLFLNKLKSQGLLAGVSGVALDGAAVAAAACGAAAVRTALKGYRRVLDQTPGISALPSNGSHYPKNHATCGYVASRDGFPGPYYPGMEKDLNGRVFDRWSNRFDTPALRGRIEGMMAETCAWIAGGRRSSVVFAYNTLVPSPWWHVLGQKPEVGWRGSRLGFALSLMFDRVGYIYNPYTGELDNQTNPENDFWLDAFSVGRDGRPPHYGSSTRLSGDDDLTNQRKCSNWLARPLAAATKIKQNGGTVWVREFTNGFAVANASNADFVFTPGKPAQKIRGRQDPQYDSGVACRSYLVPKGDSLVLIKQSYLVPASRKAVRSITCRPPASATAAAQTLGDRAPDGQGPRLPAPGGG
jgi:hypothetical protein